MKRKTGHIVLTLVCLLTVCQIFVFTGCGTQSKTPTETSLLVEQGGKITSTIVESFDKEYYTQEEDVLSYALFNEVAINFFKYRLAKNKGVDKDLADNKNKVYPV